MNEKVEKLPQTRHKPVVLVFSTSYFPYIGGAEVATREIAKRLSDKFDFFIITSRFKRNLLKVEKVPEGTIIRLGFGNILDKYFLPLFALFWAWQKPGILFGLDISAGSLAPALLKLLNPRRFFVLNIQYGYGNKRLARGRFWLIGTAFRFMLSRADSVAAISNYLLDTARKYGYKGNTVVIPNGVDLIKTHPVVQRGALLDDVANSKTIITVSRLVPKNGVDILIKAVAEIKKSIPDIHCLILGDGQEKEKLIRQSEVLNLKSKIEFFGNVSTDKVSEYLGQSDVFVRSSRSEGMGNAFLEALAAGIPIVGTPVGGIPDIIEDGKTGLFCKSENHKDLAEKILILLKNESLAKSIVENGQKMIKERFLWDEISKKYETLFNKAGGLKILIATGIFFPDIGGPATYSKLLLDELPKRGIDVKVLSFGSVRHLPKILRHIAYGLKLMAYGKTANIIFAQDPVSVGLPAALAAKLLRKKFLLKVAGDYAWEQWQQSVKGQASRRKFITPDDFQKDKFDFFTELRRKIQKYVAREAQLIITPSNYLKKIVGMWVVDSDKIEVIYNSFEPPIDFTWGSKEKIRDDLGLSGRIIVSAGRLVPWKGFNVLIEVLKDLSNDFRDLKLIIIGDGPEKESLRLMAYGLEQNIIFSSSLSREKLLEYLIAADVFALNTAYEGFSHQILEAMALGVPVVTTNIGGNPEIIRDGENGFLIGYNDKDTLRKKIAELLENKNLAEDFSLKAKGTAARFSKERMINDTIIVFQNL